MTVKYEHVFCFICPAHSLDNFFKNVFSDKPIIKMKGIEGEWEWGSDIFLKPFIEAWDVIKLITNHSTNLITYEFAAYEFIIKR